MAARAVRLGFALNLASRSREPSAVQRVYEKILDTIVYAEELGYDSVWIGQHHFDNTDGPVPSPLILLSAAAQRTTRIKLGTGITTLPLENPLRLAEDAAVLDLIAAGRLQLGVGTGGANLDGFRAFGLDSADRHSLYDGNIRLLHSYLSGDSLVPGQTGPTLFPPSAGIRSRIWQAATAIPAAQNAAIAGDGLQLGAFFDPADRGQRPKAAAYHAQWQQSFPDKPARVAVFRFVYPGDSTSSVAAELAPVLGPRFQRLAERAAISGNTELASWSLQQFLDAVTMYGAPDDIAAQIASDPVISDFASDFVANFSYGDEFSLTAARDRLDVLAREIVPRVGWSLSSNAVSIPTI